MKLKLARRVLPIAVLVMFTNMSRAAEKDALRGLPGVYVLIEELKPVATSAGLTDDTIQTDIELKLRRSGVKVFTRDESLGKPMLYCNVNIKCDDSGLCATSIDISIREVVKLVRDSNIITTAAVWHTGGTGTVGRKYLKQVREGIADQVDRFLNDYLAAQTVTEGK